MNEFRKKHRLYLTIKRVNAIIFSILFILILSPILLILLLVTLIDSKGHPIFTQERYGIKRSTFNIYKFTSMRSGEITRWGKFIRFTSLDELPQLFNILKGDMTFIGPRPLSIKEKDIDTLRMSKEYSPYFVKPGLTGYAQIHFNFKESLEIKANYDSYYVEHFSIWLDIKILFITIFKLIPISIHRK